MREALTQDHLPYIGKLTPGCSSRTELACQKLPNNEAMVLRSEMAGVLRNAKPPRSNISREERKALVDLKKEESVLILPADKGKATVIMEVSNYEQKLSEMLFDEKTYEQLPSDPTQRYKRDLVAILSRLKKENKINKTQYDLLFPTAENIPRIYGTPKIHKPGNKVRPVVDYTGTIGYQTSRALADILSPLVGTTEHHVLNSKHLSESLAEVMIEEGEIFNSHDVVSLFTNTPIDQSLDVIRSRLENDSTLGQRTLLSVEDIMQLLKFVLTTTYFLFRGTIYKQRFGAAMGSRWVPQYPRWSRTSTWNFWSNAQYPQHLLNVSRDSGKDTWTTSLKSCAKIRWTTLRHILMLLIQPTVLSSLMRKSMKALYLFLTR